MAIYLVLEPSEPAAERAEKAVVLRDGFVFLAFVVPLFWFLWHRMWVEALAYLVIAGLLGALGMLPGYGILAPLLSLLLSILIGLEAQALRTATLRRRGWEVWGVVEAGSPAEAELRYVAEVDRFSAGQRPRAVPAAPWAAPAAGAAKPTFGLIDYPGKN